MRRSIWRVWPLLLLACVPIAAWRTATAREPEKPKPVTTVMDSPIPPGSPAGVQVPDRVGYCVSWNDDAGTLGIVNVPLHRPDAGRLDELRASVRNALALVQNQLDVKAAGEPDQAKRDRYQAAAGHLKDKLARGVAFAGETKPVQKPDGPPVACTCSTLQTPGTFVGPYCSGACGDCWSCR